MELVVNRPNRSPLDKLHRDAMKAATRIEAAVAYVSEVDHPFFVECLNRKMPLQLWARLDHTVPVALEVLELFLDSNSTSFTCRLVPSIFHPKVIWWHGFGLYVGSANLSDRAWFGNIEAGIFFSQADLDDNPTLRESFEEFFNDVDSRSHELTTELFNRICDFAHATDERKKEEDSARKRYRDEFGLPVEASLTSVAKPKPAQRRGQAFLAEWNSTLQLLRKISDRMAAHRPAWVPESAPKGVQADQFLHAYYYHRVKEGQEIPYREHFEKNKNDPDAALREALAWWAATTSQPTWESEIFEKWVPRHAALLADATLAVLTEPQFVELCHLVHAIRDRANRTDYRSYGLGQKLPAMSHPERITYHAHYLFRQKSPAGRTTVQTIHWVLHGGAKAAIPERIWEAISDPRHKIPLLGVSTLGEIAGWAFPDHSPPRNGRTGKALTALGNRVMIYGE